MTSARLDGLYLLLIGCAVFIILGVALENIVTLVQRKMSLKPRVDSNAR